MNLLKNPLATLIIGLMVGLTLGYVLAERQPVPPSRAMATAGAQDGLPRTIHRWTARLPPRPPRVRRRPSSNRYVSRRRSWRRCSRNAPTTGRSWSPSAISTSTPRHGQPARDWYEKALAQQGGDPNVLTDLAVVYRNLGEPEKALELLDRALVATLIIGRHCSTRWWS